MPSVLDAARRPLLDAAPDLAGALVYLDSGAAEVVRMSLGVELLYGLGVAAVCPLEAACPEDALVASITATTITSSSSSSGSSSLPTRLAIFTSQLLSEAYSPILQALLVHQASLASVTIYSSLSQLAHAQSAATDLGVEAYAEFAAALTSGWTSALQPPPGAHHPASAPGGGVDEDGHGYDAYQRQQQQQQQRRRPAPAITVVHLPLHLVALDDTTFVLPAAADAATLAVSGERAAGYGPAEASLHEEGEEEGLSSGLALLAHALVDVAGQLGVRLHPFACGPVSAAIAKEFSTLPQRVQASAEPRDDPTADLRAAAAHLAGPGLGSASATTGSSAAAASSNSWALVLVDRSLDLASPCMHWPLDSQEAPHPLDLVAEAAPRTPQEAAAAAGWLPQGWSGEEQRRPGQQRRAGFRPATVLAEVEGLAPWDPCGLADAPSTSPTTTTTTSSSSSAGAAGKKAGRQGGTSQQQVAGKDQGSSAAAGPSSSAPAALNVTPLGLPLWHPSDKRWLDLLSQLWPAKGRNALLLLRKLVKEALRSEKVSPAVKARLSSTVTGEELLGLVGSLVAASPDIGLRHTSLLGVVCASAAALQGPRPLAWGACAALERQLLLALPQDAGGADMLLPLLLDAIEAVAAGKGVLCVDDLLQLLVVTYSLCGDRQPPAAPLYTQQEGQLKEALGAAFLAALQQQQQQQQGGAPVCAAFPELVQLQQQGASEQQLRSAISSRLAGVWQALHFAASARGKLRELRRLMVLGGSGGGVVPLVRQLLHKVQLQAELKDVAQPSAKAQGILSAGLARFGRSAIAHLAGTSHRTKELGEYPGVLLFVVGGLSSAEVREVKQEVAEHQYGHRPQVVLGGTSLLAGRDAVRLLLSRVGQ